MKNQKDDFSSDDILRDARGLARIHAQHDGNVSDKWETYLAVYDDLFSPIQSERISLLEIGVQNGGSLEVWRRYFGNAELIVGCDIDPRCGSLQFNSDRIAIVVGDATSPETKERISELHEAFDVIIDDGSHTATDIIRTFVSYFPMLRNGGVFIVEDLHSSYWKDFGGGLYKPDAPMEFFKRLLDVVNSEHWGNGEEPASLMRSFEKDLGFTIDDHLLASINSVQFSNSLCVVKKADPDRNKLGLRSVVGRHATVNPDIVSLAGSYSPRPDERENSWSQTSADPFHLRQALAESRAQVTAWSQSNDRHVGRIADLEAILQERNAQLVKTNAKWASTVAEVDDLSTRLRLAESEASRNRDTVRAVYNSTSWRLTAPVRAAKRLLAPASRAGVSPRYVMGTTARYLWAKIPLRDEAKLRLKDTVFSSFPWMFRGSRAFENWRGYRDNKRPLWTDASLLTSGVADESSVAYVPLLPVTAPNEVPARVICFYLPQFHPIPENDEWWGEGFTEWTNVRSAKKQFEGHYQPRVPGELGYYNLLDARTQRRQIELAKLYGIGGFCFYFYWFKGRRVLEKPVENYLADKSLDLPFCLCWANENWTRRWDGLDAEILLAQEHSADDDLSFIREISNYFKDDRYIRIDGRPLLVIYRPQLLPSALETSNRWRQWCRANGIGEIYLAYTQSFETVDPAIYGFDAAIEFPPNNSSVPLYAEDLRLAPGFAGTVYDWRIFPSRSDAYHQPGYTLFRTVCPSWDNTARRKSKGTIFLGSSPGLYRRWLGNAVSETVANFPNRGHRLVFVNAWNEWAEGAYLEPDALRGYAYLQATRDALEDSIRAQKRIVIVTHDAHPHGAQFIILNIAKHLRDDFGFNVDAISLGTGPLLADFAELAKLSLIDLAADTEESILEKLRSLRRQGAEIALVNTAVAGTIVPALKDAGFQVVSLIHEMPNVLKSFNLANPASRIAQHSDLVVFPANIVRDGFESFVGQRLDKARIRPQGAYLRNRTTSIEERASIRSEVVSELGFAPDTKIVLAVGYADHRKGLDLFVDAVMAAADRDPKVVGIWLGHADEGFPILSARSDSAVATCLIAFRFPGRMTNPKRYYVAADVFALTSREDPFPSVVLEALDAGLAVVAFRGAGGFEELLSRGCGVVVDAFDTAAMSVEILKLLGDRDTARLLAGTGQAIIDREFSYRHYVFDLLEFGGNPQPKISVVVPNYNYARFIEERLRTIVDQTMPIFELIVLDDASDDGSQEIIEGALADVAIPHIFIRNNANSGSAFRQWLRGVQAATGDLVWIAEADDLSDPQFLECVVRAFKSPETVMSFCQSRQMSADGTVIADDYLEYVSDIDEGKWNTSYHVDGRQEIAEALFLKNTIPNVSAVVFKRDALLDALTANEKEILSYRHVGDWVTYLEILGRGGKIAFCPASLNGHRRHQQGVTLGGFDVRHLREILRVQRQVRQRFALDGDAYAAADAYAQRLYQQFGLASDQYPLFSEHPALQELGEDERRAE